MSNGGLGIITEFTYELDKMTYANLSPLKLNIQLAIPPPDGLMFRRGLKETLPKSSSRRQKPSLSRKQVLTIQSGSGFPTDLKFGLTAGMRTLPFPFKPFFSVFRRHPTSVYNCLKVTFYWIIDVVRDKLKGTIHQTRQTWWKIPIRLPHLGNGCRTSPTHG